MRDFVNEGVYEALVKQSPGLAKAVQELISMGQTPAQIERFLVSKFGNRDIVAYAVSAAEYLYSQIPVEER